MIPISLLVVSLSHISDAALLRPVRLRLARVGQGLDPLAGAWRQRSAVDQGAAKASGGVSISASRLSDTLTYRPSFTIPLDLPGLQAG